MNPASRLALPLLAVFALAPGGALFPGGPASAAGRSVSGVTEAPAERHLPSGGQASLSVLGQEVAPGGRRQVLLRASESFAGAAVETPVLVIHGARPGPTVCFTAGIHGDELNGIEIVRTLFEHTRPQELAGTLLGVPVANLHGFRRSSRYLPDRRDLNRFFPGNSRGSSAARIASALFEGVVRHCDALVDFHTGSFHRTNLPQVRADLRIPAVLRLARTFGGEIVVQSEGRPGTLRRAAMEAGIPSVTYEAGEPMRLHDHEIERGVRGVRHLLAELEMLPRPARGRGEPLIYHRSRWVRVDDGGVFLTQRELGERVGTGDLLGTVTDPVSNERSPVTAPFPGHVIGMAHSQVVIPGFAAFHLGLDAREAPDVAAPAPSAPARAPALERWPTPDQLDAEERPE